MDHTPTLPWHYNPNGAYLVDAAGRHFGGLYGTEAESKAIGRMIVTACNSHEALLAQRDELLAACQMAAGALAMMTPSLGSPDWYVNAIEDAKRDCAAAIANAKEGAE